MRNVLKDNILYLVLKAQDNLFSLTDSSSLTIKECTKIPEYRVVVPNDIAEVIREGGNVFSKHVIQADKSLRAGDYVLVVNEEDRLIAYGKMKVSGEEAIEYKKGVAVNVKGRIKNENNT
uniref:Pseudouridine synthase n=1 Tax=Candidatus Aramenus sulfurataquae TaxID=1326980 RepID=A0A0F2LV78_9CREN